MNPDLVHFVEQATLGAFLGDPAAVGQVRPWLRANDFADWWHAQAWTALTELHAAQRPIDPAALAAALVERLGPRRAEPVRVADLYAATPSPARPVEYARKVLDGGLRREIAGHGVLLRAGALQAVLSDAAAPVASACLMVDAGIESSAARWDLAYGRHHPPSTVTPLHPTGRLRELRAGADKFLAERPNRDHVLEREHVVSLVGSLIAHPDAIPEVADWLRPAQVADPGWRAVYATITDLTARGEAVDAVTVAWNLAPLAAHDVAVPGIAELRQVAEAGWAEHPNHAARIVAADQVRALAERASDQLTTLCNDPTQDFATILDTAPLLTGALRHTARGLPSSAHMSAPNLSAAALEHGPVAL